MLNISGATEENFNRDVSRFSAEVLGLEPQDAVIAFAEGDGVDFAYEIGTITVDPDAASEALGLAESTTTALAMMAEW